MPPVRLVIQSRMASSRLPGKALLPVGGLPSVVLCAKRAANTGLPVEVATTDAPSDNANAETLADYGIPCVRGPLSNVLGRFELVTRDMPPDGVVVRLTADNLLPDGALIDEMLAEFHRRGAACMGTRSPQDGLPYGLSAEIFTVAALREAASQAESEHDREHVTPFITRKYGTGEPFRPAGLAGDFSHLRCTMDTFDDYQRLLHLFDPFDDPVTVPWRDLCQALHDHPCEPNFRVPYAVKNGKIQSQLTLGTVQLGLPYGAANQTGQPTESQALGILREAVVHGVTHIDCARAYGEAERIVGKASKRFPRDPVTVITKLDPLASLPADASVDYVAQAVSASVYRSCHALQTQKLDVLMLHRWGHHDDFGGAIWRQLLAFRADGLIGVLGASVQSPEEALQAIADLDAQYIQLPCNLLDWRWREAGVPEALSKRPDLAVHVRSALLQGVLPAEESVWPKLKDIEGYQPARWIDVLQRLTTELGRKSVTDLCLAYARALPWVDSVVVGVETQRQLADNMSLFRTPALTPDELRHVDAVLPRTPERLLNPALWNMEP